MNKTKKFSPTIYGEVYELLCLFEATLKELQQELKTEAAEKSRSKELD